LEQTAPIGHTKKKTKNGTYDKRALARRQLWEAKPGQKKSRALVLEEKKSEKYRVGDQKQRGGSQMQ